MRDADFDTKPRQPGQAVLILSFPQLVSTSLSSLSQVCRQRWWKRFLQQRVAPQPFGSRGCSRASRCALRSSKQMPHSVSSAAIPRTRPQLRQLPPPPSPTSLPAYRTASAPAAEEGSGGGGGGGGVVRSVVSLSASLRA